MHKPLTITPIPAFASNYLWLIAQDQGGAIVVDPGDARPVLDYLTQNQLTLKAVLITHHHLDHIGGIDRLLRTFDVPVYGPDSASIPQVTDPLTEGDQLRLLDGDLTLEVLAVPGHTQEHIAYYGAINSTPVIFSGDTLFAAGCGRLLGGTAQQLCHSLLRLKQLPEATLIYCAHEYTLANLAFARAVEPDNPAIAARIDQEQSKRNQNQPTIPTTMKLEKATNPFLRFQLPGVVAAINHYWQEQWSEPEALFAGLRRWKDSF